VHHIGGRGGGGPFHLPKIFWKDSPIVFYDADSNGEIEGDFELRPTYGIDACVSNQIGNATFNITHKPHASSLLCLDEKYAKAYFPKQECDDVWGTTFKVIKTVDLRVDTLDNIVANQEENIKSPDILTIDVEGSEYEILQGAHSLLSTEVVCVVAEIWFLPIRQGQKLHGDILAIMAEHGFFQAVLLQQHQELSLYRSPIGLRGRGIQVVCDAVFLLDLDKAEEKWSGEALVVKLRKAAMAALSYGQLEYVLECLKRARRQAQPEIEYTPIYWSFLDQLEKLSLVHPQEYPVVTGGDGAQNRARIDHKQKIFSTIDVIKATLKSFERTYNILSGISRKLHFLKRQAAFSCRWTFGKNTAVEKLLNEYGYTTLSSLVRKRRIINGMWLP